MHARIERRRDKFVLIDHSSNGTYVTMESEPEIALRREEMVLRGRGQHELRPRLPGRPVGSPRRFPASPDPANAD